jgi:drug/metabolite transporter (DMT)-like permease
MSVTKAISLNSTGPFITLIFSWIILSQKPTFYQVFAMIPLMLGVLLLTDNLKFKNC